MKPNQNIEQDFIIESTPMTIEEKQKLSEFIAASKAKYLEKVDKNNVA